MSIEQSTVIPQVSIVVPVFNTEQQYLDVCLQSLVNQTEPEIEIILVNDGSTDSSGAICDLWTKKDSRIKVIHKENGGEISARKIGVEHSNGEWICFVDSDDTLPEKAIHILLKYVKDDIDMIIGRVEYTGKWKWPYKYSYEEKNTLQYIKSLLVDRTHFAVWGRLTRKNLFDYFIFDIPRYITHGCDIIMTIRLSQNARKVIYIPDIIYNYIWQPNSVMAKGSPYGYDKNYRLARDSLFYQSIEHKYRKYLQPYILYHYFISRYKLFKRNVKRILHR